MGVKGKLVAELELRSSAERVHEQLRHKPHLINTFSPHVQKCELLEGNNFGQHGGIIRWHYTLPDGKAQKAKVRAEFNDQTKEVCWTLLEGDLEEDYTYFIVTVHPTTRPRQTNLIKWTLNYEKRRDDAPHPYQLFGLFVNLSDHMEAEHLKSA